jgi:RimJ/RimL family protein N-acetyltransferase
VDVYLETERMTLRYFTLDDLELVIALDADPGVKRYIDGGAPVDRDEVAETLDWWLGYPERTPGYGFWAAIERSTEQFLGWFHLRPGEGDPPDEPELGYRLHSRTWGQGFATEGARALVDVAFARQGAGRVHAETMAVNTGSRRVMEKAGLRLERQFHAEWPVRIAGDEHGDVEYAITRAEWEANRNTAVPDADLLADTRNGDVDRPARPPS